MARRSIADIPPVPRRDGENGSQTAQEGREERGNTEEEEEGGEEDTPQEEPQEGAQEVDARELEEDGLTESVKTRLDDWVERNRVAEQEPEIWLYKYDNPRSGRHCALIGKPEDIPDEHSVGVAYGPGRYLVMVQLPRTAHSEKRVRAFRFRCADTYQELHDQYKAQLAAQSGRPPAPGSVNASDPSTVMAAGLEMVGKVIGMLTPILKATQQPAQSVDVMGQNMLTAYNTMGQTLLKQTAETARLIRDNAMADDEDDSDDGDDGDDVVSKVAQLASEWLPQILGKGPGAAALATAVKHAPDFRRIKRDPEALGKVVDYLDKTYGADKVDKLLTKLAVKRPG